MAVLDQATTDTICANYDFTTLKDIQFFLRATWYGGPYLESFEAATGINKAETDILFDITNPTSFGGCYNHVLTEVIYPYYKCNGTNSNCTSTELANLQWGSSYLTSHVDPTFSFPKYLPQSTSIYTSW